MQELKCLNCGAILTGAERDFVLCCTHCGSEYQVSLQLVHQDTVDVEQRIDDLIDCVLRGNDRERSEACLELRKIRDARVVKPVIRAIKELFGRCDDYRKYQAAQDALRDMLMEMKDPGAAEVLAGALRDESINIRQLAAMALENIGAPSTAEALCEAARDESAHVRAAAVHALGSIQDQRVLPTVEAAMEEGDYSIKMAAISSLGRLRHRPSARRIGEILLDTNGMESPGRVSWNEVRHKAAYALADMGGDEAAGYLLEALDDRDEKIRDTCRIRLGALRKTVGDATLGKTIERALKALE
jgi:HEAT repeat protein